MLSPLVVRRVDATRREDPRRIEETRRYLAYAFGGGAVTVPAASFKARPEAGGRERVVSGEELRLQVAAALSPETPGPVELPGEPLPAPSAWAQQAALIALGLVALAWMLRRRAQRAGAAFAAPPPPAHGVALARLQRLRERRPRGLDEFHADAVEASSLVRTYIEARFSLFAPEMTTEEFLTDPRTARALHGSQREMLSEFLRHCDLVKFARHQPLDAERERLLDAVAAFVLETRATLDQLAAAGSGVA